MRTLVIQNGVEYRPFDHLYAVSKDGGALKLRSLEPAYLSQRKDGYVSVGRRRLLHRMVAHCWLHQPVGANHVHHKNGVKDDNRADNLEWLTPKQHAALHPGRGTYDRTEETRRKLRDHRTGRKTSEETKEKQRLAAIRIGSTPPPRPVGTKCSAEAKAKMRANSPNAVKCRIDGVVYRSFSEAGEVLGVKPHTLRKRCLSANFGNYEMIMDVVG